ncbi:MAG TPA: amino acid racemase [Prolixibacteraceae bacterium]|jgi:aspartate racemase|nr:amino acid racemase [Prolixibacteraceae bacterium]HPR85526.1 amino acid racemase [Prolixibacteraceae bacterium]
MLKNYKTIGMIGGIAPASTVDYYQRIISRFQERTGLRDYPSLLINSINMNYMMNLVSEGQLDELVDYLSEEIYVLEKAGAKVIFMASNTPHIVYEPLARRVKAKMVSIVDSTIAYAKTKGYNRLGLFGTISTMEGDFYQDGFDAVGMEIITPMSDERKYIHKVYMEELVRGRFLPETKNRLLSIANRMYNEGQIECLILGGTELPLIIKTSDIEDVELLNTTKIHVEHILDAALG